MISIKNHKVETISNNLGERSEPKNLELDEVEVLENTAKNEFDVRTAEKRIEDIYYSLPER